MARTSIAMEPTPVELALIMPVFNESEGLRPAVAEWIDALNSLGVEFAFHLYDDGSADATGQVLSEMAGRDARLVVHRLDHRGHGPTILQGYREQAGTPWVLQTDSDGEIAAHSFPPLWDARGNFDLLVGRRPTAGRPVARRIVSGAARLATALLFGAGIRDVNVPLRLFRSETFRCFLRLASPTSFAPNVLMSGYAALAGLRVAEFPVESRRRPDRVSSLRRLRLATAVRRSLSDAVGFRVRYSVDRHARVRVDRAP
jgi:glycosyltransferase involved in cell wall biosynthesis